MQLLRFILPAAMLAAANAQASSIVVLDSRATPESASTVALQALRPVEAVLSGITPSMTAVGTPPPAAQIAGDARSRPRIVRPPLIIRAGVKTEPAIHAVAPSRKPAAKPDPETEVDEDIEAVAPPAVKLGPPL